MQTLSSAAPLELIGLDFFHLWHMQRWLPVFASVNWPFLKVCPGISNNKNCSRPVIQWLQAEVWSTMKDSQWPGKRIWEQTIFPTIKVLWYPTTQDHKLPPIDQWQTKRMNHKILAMLKTLPEHYKTQWKNNVTKLVHAYNCTKYSSTGYSPYYLMFGCVPHLPIDLILPTCCSTTPSLLKPSYVETWKDQLKEAYQLAFQHSNEIKTKDVIRRNTKWPWLTTLEPLERVLICNLWERGRAGTMRSYREEKIYIIILVMTLLCTK